MKGSKKKRRLKEAQQHKFLFIGNRTYLRIQYGNESYLIDEEDKEGELCICGATRRKLT